jgi:hypothetical protein
MLGYILSMIGQHAVPSPSPPVKDGYGVPHPLLLFNAVPILSVVAVASVTLVLTFRGEDGWTVTPVSTTLIPTTAVLVECANNLLINLLFPFTVSVWSPLPRALFLGTATVLGGAVKQRRSGYVAISASASAIALFVTLTHPINPSLGLAKPVLGLLGVILGYTTASSTHTPR